MMNEDSLCKIYEVVLEFIRYRKYESSSQSKMDKKQLEPLLEKVDKKEFLNTLLNTNLFIIKIPKMMVIISKPNTKFSSLLAESKKKIIDICSKNSDLEEFIYIADIHYVGLKSNTSTNIPKIVNELNNIYPKIWFQIRPYTTFYQRFTTECEIIVKHEIISQEEGERLLKAEYKTIKNIPKIFEWDPPIVWEGGKKGMFVLIHRLSGSTIIHKTQRYIIDKGEI